MLTRQRTILRVAAIILTLGVPVVIGILTAPNPLSAWIVTIALTSIAAGFVSAWVSIWADDRCDDHDELSPLLHEAR